MGPRLTFQGLTKKQTEVWPKWFFVGWVVVINLFNWVIYGAGVDAGNNPLILWHIVATLISIPVGWFFGIKLMIAPLGAGVITLNEPAEEGGETNGTKS